MDRMEEENARLQTEAQRDRARLMAEEQKRKSVEVWAMR
jgi:hypothetical protein